MLAHKHPDYDREKKQLKNTCKCLMEEKEYLSQEVVDMEEEINKLKRSVGGSYSDELIVKTTIHESNKRKLRQLKRAEEKPYFGRIDFKELGKEGEETFYIGKTSLTRRADEERLVVDWRAPIASLYYSGEIGEVMYKAPGGLIMGDLSLKRQYEINKQNLENIFDKGLAPMDEYLQEALWEKKDNRLKDIVNTIQGEQNDIIRADERSVLIVQGVAGSGKTTIVLHRIAYLMYTFQEMFQADKLLILVPNSLFLNYISDVLPDLGVEEIKQSTFENLAMELLEDNYSLTKAEDKLIKLLHYTKYSNEFRNKLERTSFFKGSMDLKDILDKHLSYLSENIVPQVDFMVDEYCLFSYKEIREMFDKDYSYLPLIPRAERIRKYIETNIKNKIKDIQNKIIKDYDRNAIHAKRIIKESEELKSKLITIYEERDSKCSKLEKSSSTAISTYFRRWTNLSIKGVYESLICNTKLLKEYSNNKLGEEDIEFISQYTKQTMEKGLLDSEDLVPLLYLRMKLLGLSMKGKFNHIVIDEAQDYSELQMFVLKQLSSNDSFTIVGDLSQGIHSYKGINSWEDLMKDVFIHNEKEFKTLKKCYRSTMEIMNFANKIIEKWKGTNITLAEPVLRSGDKPLIVKGNSDEEILSFISSEINQLNNNGYKSLAIICKTSEESMMVYEKLKAYTNKDVDLISDKDTMYKGGIVVIPSYLAKGLEFDAVIVYDCSKENYIKDELHTKLLYVSVTRPLHKLIICYKGEQSELISDIEEEVNRGD